MQNGTRKGAGTQTMPTMRTSPGLEDIWQLHWGYGAGIEQNSAGVFIANVDDNATIAGVLTAPPRGAGRAAVACGSGRRRPGLRVAAPAGRCASGPARPGAGAPGPDRARADPPRELRYWCAGRGWVGPAQRADQQLAALLRRGCTAQQVLAGGRAWTGGGGGGAAAAHTPAYWIKISARPDGTFTVTNSRKDSARHTRSATRGAARVEVRFVRQVCFTPRSPVD